jgi:hypothetical protein
VRGSSSWSLSQARCEMARAWMLSQAAAAAAAAAIGAAQARGFKARAAGGSARCDCAAKPDAFL